MSEDTKSFLYGFMKAFDLTGKLTPRPSMRRPAVNDAEAMKDDWKKVGESVRVASRNYSKQKNLRYGS